MSANSSLKPKKTMNIWYILKNPIFATDYEKNRNEKNRNSA